MDYNIRKGSYIKWVTECKTGLRTEVEESDITDNVSRTGVRRVRVKRAGVDNSIEEGNVDPRPR